MLTKLFKDDYSDGRTAVDSGIIEKILNEALKISAEVDLSPSELSKAVLLLMSGVSYYLYLHPEQYIDFGKFVAYRAIDLQNLWTVAAKRPENAKTIYEYYKRGGFEMEEIKRLVAQYASDMLDDSIKRANKLSEDINKLGNIVSQDDNDNTIQKTKEN